MEEQNQEVEKAAAEEVAVDYGMMIYADGSAQPTNSRLSICECEAEKGNR
jgi:hypothetical protein